MSKISTFAARCMQLISGQMPLPQSTFRAFLEDLNDDMSAAGTETDGKMPIPASATNGNLAKFDSNKKVVDSGISIAVSEGKLVFTIGDNTYTVSPDSDATAGEE